MISLAYILKNEEAYIERSLLSIKDIADEIVAIDFGSEDGTTEILKKFNVNFKIAEWNDDFSDARNKLKSFCSEPWILMVDADEHFEGENVNLIKHAVNISEDDFVGWELPRKNHYPLHDSDSPYHSHPFFPDFQLRLFKNIPEIFFSGTVHEGVKQSIEVADLGQIGRLSVFLHHHLFRGNQRDNESKKRIYYEYLNSKGENDG